MGTTLLHGCDCARYKDRQRCTLMATRDRDFCVGFRRQTLAQAEQICAETREIPLAVTFSSCRLVS